MNIYTKNGHEVLIDETDSMTIAAFVAQGYTLQGSKPEKEAEEKPAATGAL